MGKKTPKKTHEWHTANTKYGMGDYYGTGVRQNVGRMRDDSMGLMSSNPKRINTPPKNLA